ncbi:MAG: DUF3322 domain-containing protein [Caldilineaceae bacterium]
MITPQAITQKAQRAYLPFLRSKVTGASFFPLVIPFGKPAAAVAYVELKNWVADLLAQAKATVGYGYTVELETRTMRLYGEQSLPARIFIETEQDFLRLLGKQREAARFDAMVELTRRQLPQLLGWLARYPQRLVETLAIWPDLLQVCTYFLENPRPGRYLRELPIAVHTKFIEENSSILRQLLDLLLPAEAIQAAETAFERRFFLRYDEPLLRVRLLDPALQAALQWPATDLSLPFSQATALPLAGKRVIISENKMNFLTLPALPDTVALWGQGFQVNALHAVAWLQTCTIWYWGDLDVQGLQILAQVRALFPQTHALMMDRATVDAFHAFAVTGTPTPHAVPPQLTAEEGELYAYLAANQLRLEQERIHQAYVLQHLP